ncbi:hypothetical protein [Methanococcus maripaludis]|uniref:DUF4129 domain-containing protein n=2 Tax=Methanococcus maripaludis TaxID=39152 RepID=A0A8T3VZ80_METMI|nr:hypothetical protein [Methanococcus maripaludis]AEK19251.1 hypothetical protein GYY_01820 [Methanococcus maripaludis X1]MBG0769567.1 hypothetical protein [Methanococcus maripaludis]
MSPFKSKILFIVFIISFLSFSAVTAENINLENLKSDDTYVYSYFNTFLGDYDTTINKMIQNNITYINDSKSSFEKTAYLNSEINVYKEYGMDTPAISVIPYFYDFSENLEDLSGLCQEFNKNLELNTTSSKYFAKLIGADIVEKIHLMKSNLRDIKDISELKKDNETLNFDTSNVEKSLDYLELKFSKNIENIGNVTPSSNLTIFISPKNPLIYENTTIYGTGLNGNGKIIITGPENITENIVLKNNHYSTQYLFKKSGIYTLKLTQYGRESEDIDVNISKIPTKIISESYFEFLVLKENNISGKVIDFYGNSINSGDIIFENENLNLENGTFNISLYADYEKIENYTLKFSESEKYLSSEKNIEINFSKPLLNIQIYSEIGKINKNEPLTITGTFEKGQDLNLKLWVGNNSIEYFNSNGTFKKEILFEKPGNYEVFVTFDGNDYYDLSKSNVLMINVTDDDKDINLFTAFISQAAEINWKILILILLIIAFGIKFSDLYNIFKNKTQEKTVKKYPDNILPKSSEKSAVIEKTVLLEYQELYNKIMKKYNINVEFTPNELLKYLKKINPKIYYDLKIITKIHEKAVYGKEKLDNNTLKQFHDLTKRVLENL